MTLVSVNLMRMREGGSLGRFMTRDNETSLIYRDSRQMIASLYLSAIFLNYLFYTKVTDLYQNMFELQTWYIMQYYAKYI